MPQFVGVKIRAIRRARGLTQAELARQAGLVTREHLTKVERGEDPPSLDLVVRLANALGIAVDYLLRDGLDPVDVAEQWHVATKRDVGLFAPRFRQLRAHQHLTQVEVMQRLGLARQGYVSNLETGRKLPSLDLMVRIADLFAVDVDDLLQEIAP